MTASELEELAARVDRSIAAVDGLSPEARAKALAMKSAIEEFHKAGLTAIVKTLKGDGRGKELLFALVDDPAVHALFAMHGLVRADLRTRVSRVLDMVRPYMQSHGGDVELVEVQPDTVFIRLAGSCNGCSMSDVTLRNTVEEALREHLPQITKVEVLPNEPEPQTPGGFVALGAVEGAPPAPEHGWTLGPRTREVAEAVPYRWDLPGAAGQSVLLVRYQDRIQAFRNECAHLGMPLDGGRLDAETGILTCPWHGFRFDCSSGECITSPEAQLEPLPLRVERGFVLVRTAEA